MPDRILLEGGVVLTGPLWSPASLDVLIVDGRIEAVLPPDDLAGVDAARHDATDRLVIPGLVNAHTHSHTLPFRGVARDWTLETSLLHGPWLGGDRSDELAELCALLAATEMIQAGATGAFDLIAQSGGPSISGLAAAARGYRHAGMRAVIAPMVADRSVHEAIPAIGRSLAGLGCSGPTGGPSAASIIAGCRAFAESVGGGLVTAAVAPTIPAHCSPELVTGLHGLAEERGLRVHLHLAESDLQARAGSERFGHSITAELQRLGILDDRLTVAHAIWIDQADRSLLAAAGAVAVTVPGSNLRLGSGVADTRATLEAGITMAIGSDGANSADALDVLDAARLAALLPRTSSRPPAQWPTVPEVLDAATTGGAAACGWSDVGRIAPGHAGDLTMLDLRSRAFVPPNDLANQLLTSARASDVTDVMVGGRWVYRHRTFPQVDVEKATDRFVDLVGELHERLAPARASAADQSALVTAPLATLRRPGHALLPGGPHA